jgi:hypothetical protein
VARATFSLDDATIAETRRTAARLRKPQSHVVRDAVAEYAARADCLSDGERQHLMGVLERLRHARPARPAADVDAELKSIRSARRTGGRAADAVDSGGRSDDYRQGSAGAPAREVLTTWLDHSNAS